MTETQHQQPPSLRASRIVLLAVVAVIAALWLTRGSQSSPLASVALADGKVLHIEKVSFAAQDRIGQHDYYSPYFHWLPGNLGRFLAPTKGESTVNLGSPALIVWVDATEAKSGKDVDAQDMRMQFVDTHGELWDEQASGWASFQGSFSRMDHVFTCFPRDEATLTLRVTSRRNKQAGQIEIKNPHWTAPAVWTGLPLPQHQAAGLLEIVLTKLTLTTNGDSAMPARYWNPTWQLLRGGVPAAGWDEAEWEAEDPLGNRGRTPNVHQPVLRFSATFHPSATNFEEAVLLAALPKIDLTSSATNRWNITKRFQSNEIDALGFFPPGTYVFCNGQFTNYNPGLRPVRGGASSRWTGISRFVGAGRKEVFHAHYTPSPVIYLRYKEDEATGRIALRFRNGQGACWLATPQSEEGPDDIHPFMMSPRAGVKIVTPEIVCLKPVKATFLVNPPTKTP